MSVDLFLRRSEVQLEKSRRLSGELSYFDFGWIHLGHDTEDIPVVLSDGTNTFEKVCRTDGNVSSLPDESRGQYINY